MSKITRSHWLDFLFLFVWPLVKVSIILVTITTVVFCIAVLAGGCSALHPSDRTPDATWVASDGHTYHGWRTGRKGSVAHAGGCPHPDHVKMQPDTIYANQVTEGQQP